MGNVVIRLLYVVDFGMLIFDMVGTWMCLRFGVRLLVVIRVVVRDRLLLDLVGSRMLFGNLMGLLYWMVGLI